MFNNTTKSLLLLFFCIATLSSAFAQLNVLHYDETTGFDHNTRNESLALFTALGITGGYTVVQDSDGSEFTMANLANFDLVIFSNTSGSGGLNASQQAALEWFIDVNGGSLMGIHAATDTYRHSSANGGSTGSWDWFAETLGGSVQQSPNHTSSNHVDTMNELIAHPSTENMIFPWVKQEEYYYWENGYLNSDIVQIFEVEETGGNSYDAARPMGWYRTNVAGAKIFYTALGHKKQNFTGDFPQFEQLMEDAVLWLLACDDSDGDSVCDADDICAGFDDNADSDNDGTPDGCDDCDNNLIGTSCDDANPNTENDLIQEDCSCAGTLIAPEVTLQLKVFLEGPYNSGDQEMVDNLRQLPSFPLNEPFTAQGYNHVIGGGESTAISVLNTTGSDAIVDWIFVELRDGQDPSLVLSTTSALVQKDGDIVAVDGLSFVQMNTASSDFVYVVLRYKNHLGVRTNEMYPTNGNIIVDFSSLAFVPLGEEFSMKIIDGKKMLVAGDCNSDGQVNSIDKNLYWRLENGLPFGYLTTTSDVNLDGVANAIDLNLYLRGNFSRVEIIEE